MHLNPCFVTSFVNLDKLFNLLVLQFPYLRNRDNNSACLIDLLGGLNDGIGMKPSQPCFVLRMCVCMCVCVRVCMCLHTCGCEWVGGCVLTCMHTCVSVPIHMHMCGFFGCVHMYMNVIVYVVCVLGYGCLVMWSAPVCACAYVCLCVDCSSSSCYYLSSVCWSSFEPPPEIS